MQEVPTLRLITLRRLLKGAPPPVLESRTPVATMFEHDAAFAVVVDATRAVCGTVSRDEAWFATDAAPAESVMSTSFVALEPEDDADTAAEALRARNADRVVVIARNGELLGVLTGADIMR
jgi:Mg/Co/Ni transporter MgtE